MYNDLFKFADLNTNPVQNRPVEKIVYDDENKDTNGYSGKRKREVDEDLEPHDLAIKGFKKF